MAFGSDKMAHHQNPMICHYFPFKKPSFISHLPCLPFAQPPTTPYRSPQCLRSKAAALVPPITADEVFGIGTLVWNGNGDGSNSSNPKKMCPSGNERYPHPAENDEKTIWFSLISWSSKILPNWNPLKRVHDWLILLGKRLVEKFPRCHRLQSLWI